MGRGRVAARDLFCSSLSCSSKAREGGITRDTRDNLGSGGRGMQGGGGREVFPLKSNDPSLSGEE